MKTASRELFELCKQLYDATGWDAEYKYFYGTSSVAHDRQHSMLENTPLYTSDYLLEKLAKDVTLDGATAGTWQARKFYRNADGKQIPVYSEADTPLKALLKLTLKLHEEGLV